MRGNTIMYKVLRPNYFEKFRCIGGDCEETCCAGWKIDIDRKTYKTYMKCKDVKMRKILERSIKRNRKSKSDHNYASFKLIDGKCTFLNEDNLCDIYIKLGEKSMCYTCKIYPRKYNYVNEITQQGLTLSCIEAAKLVLMNKETMEFDLVETNQKQTLFSKILKSNRGNNFLENNFEEMREFSIDIVQNRKFSIEERLIILGLFCKDLNNILENNISISNLINKYNDYISKGYYENILEKINIEKTIDAQLSLLVLLSKNIVFNKVIVHEKYFYNLSEMIKGLKLNDNIDDCKANFVKVYDKEYKNFICDKEYIYENYLVNYMFNELFPYNVEDNISKSYITLIVNFVMIKLNAIGLCAYYKENMSEYKLVELIQSYSKSMLHEDDLNIRIQEYLKSTNQDTINHMILMIGK